MNIKEKVAQLETDGFCIIKNIFPSSLIDASRDAFWPYLINYLSANVDKPNRGPHRHFLAMPFHLPIFSPGYFFDPVVLQIVHGALGNKFVADQWSCDVPVLGSQYQNGHIDYQRPLFSESPDLVLPAYMLVVNFGLQRIAFEHGPIEIAPGTHTIPQDRVQGALCTGDIRFQPVPLEIGDVLIRHPWALHRGTPNLTNTPRILLSVRYVRHWYADDSREVAQIPRQLWQSFTADQKCMLRFPIGD